MSIKMSLDVPALERLFKDDKELEVQLKQGVLMNFVDKNLRILLKDEFIKEQISQLTNNIKSSLDKTIGDEIGKVKRDWTGRIESVKLNPEFQTTLAINAKAAVADEVAKAIHEKIDQYLTTKEIDRYIERAVSYKLSDLTKAEVDRRVTELLKKA